MIKFWKSFTALVLTMSICVPFVYPKMAEAADISGWNVNYVGGVDADVYIDNEITYSGNGALKMDIRTPILGNVYVQINQKVPVEAGKKYYVGAKVKAKNATCGDLMIDWGKRYRVTQFGATFDWTNFEYLYQPDETGVVTWMFSCEGTAEYWVDDCIFIDIETGENLLKNPHFDTEGNDDISDMFSADNLSNDEIYNRIITSDSFSEDDINKVIGGFKYIPVTKAKNIVVDGKTDDWKGYSSIAMPTLSSQYQVYMKDERLLDIVAACRFCYDEDYLYMLIEVEDDVNHYLYGSGSYWVGDSLQMAVSTMDEGYGSEIGLAVDPETGVLDVWGLGSSLTPMQAKGSHNGTHTVYEFAYPWDAKFSSAPEQLKFDILVNDNDGDGRRYCAELAPGISEGKTNAMFPVMEILQGEKDWYGWIQSRSGTNLKTDTEYIYDYFLVNKSDKEKQITIQAPDGKTENVIIPATSGIRREYKNSYLDEGDFVSKVIFSSDGIESVSSVKVTVTKPTATVEETKEAIKVLEKQVDTLKKLIKKCDGKGIDTTYEDAHLFILEDTINYLNEDISNSDLDRVHYTARVTTRIYEEDKEKLEAYLNGTKEPLVPNKYVDSDIRLDDKYFYAMVEKPDGTVEEDTVFFNGYGHSLNLEKLENMDNYGGNVSMFEIGPSRCMSTYPYWTIENNNKAVGTYSYDTDVIKEGEHSFKMVYESKLTAHQYYNMYQAVDTVPGKSYKLSGWIKAENIREGTFNMFANNWSEHLGFIGTFDWQEFEKEFVATSDRTYVRLTFQSPCDAMWLDDMKLVDVDEPEVNLLRNGDFETGDGEMPVFDEAAPDIVSAIEKLKVAEENNVYIDMLLSPHYFFDDIIKKHNIEYTGHGFINYNVNAPVARQIIEDYLRHLIPIIKDYPALKSVTLSNEPAFDTKLCGEFYNEDWWDYLRERYNNNIAELNAAYAANYSDFNEVTQFADQKNPAHNYDYVTFTQTIFTEWHRWMAGIIKEIAPEIPVSIKEFAYLRFEPTNMLHFSMNHEMLDFIDLNGCDAYNNLENSTGPVDKELWYDYMQSIYDLPVIDTENHNLADKIENSFNEFAATHVYRDIFNGAVHGRSNAISWILARNADKNNQVRGNIMYRPDAMVRSADATYDLNRLTEEIKALREEPLEVGILYSVPTLYNDDSHPQALTQAYSAVAFNGKMPRFVVESQLDKMDRYDVLIVPNTKWVKDATLDKIAEFIRMGGKVLIMGESCLAKNDKNLDLNPDVRSFVFENSKVIKFYNSRNSTSNEQIEELHEAYRQLLKENDLLYAELIDTATGKNARDVEFILGVKDGKIIINIVSADKKRGNKKTLKLYINGEEITSRLLLQTMEEETGSIELGALEVKTYEIETDNPFFDTYSNWGRNEIAELYGKGLLSGISNSRFNPQANISRAEFLALVTRVCGIDEAVYAGQISDVASDKWYANTVAAALKAGFIGTDEFRPEDAITREEMCEMLVKAYEKKNGVIEASKASFSDTTDMKNEEIVAKIEALGIVKGYDDGNFRPAGTATRVEAGAVINRFDNVYKGE